jgi:hypothetical protein
MSFYGVYPNPLNFSINDPMFSLQSTVSLMKNQILNGNNEVAINSASQVTITAENLITGRIVRTGLTNDTQDNIDTASNIISVFKAKVKSISDQTTIPNGASFECQVHNPTNEEWGLYSNTSNGVKVGGSTDQVGEQCSAVLTIIVNDQASLGAGHSDQVFICISRCSTELADDLPL